MRSTADQLTEILSLIPHGLKRRPRSLTLGRRKPGCGRVGDDLFLPTLLFYPLIKPGCVRIGGDGHPGAPHGPPILPGQLREILDALFMEFGLIFMPGGDFPPSSLLRAVLPRKPVVDV